MDSVEALKDTYDTSTSAQIGLTLALMRISMVLWEFDVISKLSILRTQIYEILRMRRKLKLLRRLALRIHALYRVTSTFE